MSKPNRGEFGQGAEAHARFKQYDYKAVSGQLNVTAAAEGSLGGLGH